MKRKNFRFCLSFFLSSQQWNHIYASLIHILCIFSLYPQSNGTHFEKLIQWYGFCRFFLARRIKHFNKCVARVVAFTKSNLLKSVFLFWCPCSGDLFVMHLMSLRESNQTSCLKFIFWSYHQRFMLEIKMLGDDNDESFDCSIEIAS